MGQFDDLLYEVSEDVVKELPNIEKRIFPWATMFAMIIWGFVFQLFLDPMLASVLLLQAFFIGYSENKYFKRAYWIQWVNLIANSLIHVFCALPFWEAYMAQPDKIKLIMMAMLNYLTLYNLAKALMLLNSQSEYKSVIWEKLKTVRLLIIIDLIIRCAFQVISVPKYITLFWIVFICIYIKVIRNLIAVRDLMIYQRYSIMPVIKKKQRLNKLFIGLELLITLIAIVGLVKFSTVNSEQVQLISLEEECKGYDDAEVENVREHMIALGMEEYIVNDLLPQDVMRFKNVKNILKTSQTQYVELADADVKVTLYVGELLYRENEVEDYRGNVWNGGTYLDETLIYVEWLQEPKQAYGIRLDFDFSDAVYQELLEDRRFIQIAQKNGTKQYYEFNYKDGDPKYGSSSDSVVSGKLLDGATQYRSYGVQRTFASNFADFDPWILIQVIKEKATYPFYSLLDNDRYFDNETDTFFNFTEQKNDNIYFKGGIKRDITDYESHLDPEIIDDCKDDYNAERKYQHALFSYCD